MERVAQWKKAKDLFVQLVLKEATPQLGRQRLVAPVIDKYDSQVGPLFKQLDELEKTFLPLLKGTQTPPEEMMKVLSDYSKVANTVNGQINTLFVSLQASIDKFKTNEAPGNPKMKENLVRGLKVLKTSLDSLDKSSDAWIVQQKLLVEGRTKQLNTFETMAASFTVTLRAALARALAAAQRLKAKPTKETYNNEFPKAARDITQQIGNVKKLAEKGFAPPGPKDPSALFNSLKPFADGDLSNIDEMPPDQVMAIVTRFNKAVKAVADAYNIH